MALLFGCAARQPSDRGRQMARPCALLPVCPKRLRALGQSVNENETSSASVSKDLLAIGSVQSIMSPRYGRTQQERSVEPPERGAGMTANETGQAPDWDTAEAVEQN